MDTTNKICDCCKQVIGDPVNIPGVYFSPKRTTSKTYHVCQTCRKESSCPECRGEWRGNGEVQVKYANIPGTSSESCPLCKGSGKIEFEV